MIANIYFNLETLKNDFFRNHILKSGALMFDSDNTYSVKFDGNCPYVSYILRDSVNLDTIWKYFEKYTYKIILTK